jgi:hypothetical protein
MRQPARQEWSHRGYFPAAGFRRWLTRLRRLDPIIEQSRAEVPIEVLRRSPKATS